LLRTLATCVSIRSVRRIRNTIDYYAELLTRVQREGLLDRRPTYLGQNRHQRHATVAGWMIFVLLVERLSDFDRAAG
jgi:hypothetical protein